MEFVPNQTRHSKAKLQSILDQKLYDVPGTDENFTWAHSLGGHFITGTISSGKTSGPGFHIAKAMMQAGYGMVVFCVKKEERAMWEDWVSRCGRQSDLIIFDKGSGLKFNFLEYIMRREGEGAGENINVINTLMNLQEQSKMHNPSSGGKEDRYWDNSMRQLMNMNISLLELTREEISVRNMRRVTASCFKGKETEIYKVLKDKVKDPDTPQREKEEAIQELFDWSETNYFVSLLEKLDRRQFVSEIQQEDAMDVVNYWLYEFPAVGKRTEGIIISSFHGVVDYFVGKGILRDHFSEGLSQPLIPENVIKNKSIVLVDFPVKEFMLSGIYAQTIYKMMFMEAMERREVAKEVDPKPIAIWIDEYQNLTSPLSDSLYQLSARSVWGATVFITQSILNLYFMMGDNQPVNRAKSLIGNLNIKYWCANDEMETNKHASSIIGSHYADTSTVSIDSKQNMTRSKSKALQQKVTADYFTGLKTGRKENGYMVEALVFKVGKKWGKDRKNYAVAKFDQRA